MPKNGAVVTYRLFCMDRFGKITGTETIEAAEDGEAIEHARILDLSENCEVWQGQRLVAKLSPERLQA